MARRNPSDLLEFRDNDNDVYSHMAVGDAREFLESPTAILHPKKLLKIARGISHVLHQEVDFDERGLQHLLPEEAERRQQKREEFLKQPEAIFPAEQNTTS